MRLFTLLFAFLSFGSLSAQHASSDTGKDQNPPSFHDREMTPQVLAEIKTMEIVKACGLTDKVEISELMRIFYEFELDLSMEMVNSNPEKRSEMSQERDNKVKSLLGNQKMALYEKWKTTSLLEANTENRD